MSKQIAIKVKAALNININELEPFQLNLKDLTEERFEKLKKEIEETGIGFCLHVWKSPEGKWKLLDGHQRHRVLTWMAEHGYSVPPVPCAEVQAASPKEARKRIMQAISQYGEINKDGMYEFMIDSEIDPIDLDRYAPVGIDLESFKVEFFDDPKVGELSEETKEEMAQEEQKQTTLASRFLVPPFSILDARQGYWLERKRYWLAKGIESEVGRGDNLLNFSETVQMTKSQVNKSSASVDHEKLQALRGTPSNPEMIPGYYDKIKAGMSKEEIIKEHQESGSSMTTGTSVFDPVLCELLYRWYSPTDATILDPFAGGSVRGVIASHLGRSYTGIELRAEQVQANEAQMGICGDTKPSWIKGDSLKELDKIENESKDFLMSCPPYGDLEVYSEEPEDISNKSWDEFLSLHSQIIAKAAAKLKKDRFAAWVIGEIRFKDKDGYCRNFVSETIKAFEACGLKLYNDAVLVTSIGTLPMRAGRIFTASRKLGRTHQYALIFCKGSPHKAVEACGPVELDSADFDDVQPVTESTEFGELVTNIGGEL